MEFKILPITTQLNSNFDLGEAGNFGGINLGNSAQMDVKAFARPFLFLLITQGFFAGLIIGKISEGNVKAGLKHSFVLVAIAWLISTGAEVFLG